MGELFAYPRLYSIPMQRVSITEAEKEKTCLLPGDLLFARRSLVAEGAGKCSIIITVNEETTFESSIIRARPNKRYADSLFLFYYFTSPIGRGAIRSIAREMAVSGITGKDLANLLLRIPSLGEQLSIAAILSCLDDKIELNNRIIANLEAQAQAIFKSWFVDFEPFQDGEFEESELGLIPKGWRVQSIESVAEKVAMGPFGSNIKVNTFVNDGVPIISGQHLRGLYLDEISYNFISGEHANKLKNSLVYPKDIIFTHAGNIGQVAQIPDDCDYPYYIISQRQFYLRCDRKKVVPEYVNYYFHSAEGQGKLLANATQTGVPSIARPSSHLKAIVVPVPPIELQSNWFQIVEPMLKSLTFKIKENRKLVQIRDTLLPKLMSGEIEVPVEGLI